MWKPTDRHLAVVGLASLLVLAACSGASSPSASPGQGSPSPTPVGSPDASPTAPTGEVTHPTGPTDLVLRFEEGGGFVMPTFAMVQVPYFSLYGDGTVIYRSASAPFPEPKPGEPMRFPPMQVAKMTETQVQALLRDALGPAGLAVAKPKYENMFVADAPTAVFTIDADGRQKQVSAYALGFDGGDPANPDPDADILAAMAAFAERLRNFDQEVAKGNATDTGVYRPDRFRASLLEGGPGGDTAPRAWPWPTFGPDAFTAAVDATGLTFPSKVLDPIELGLLGVEDPEGGLSGITLRGPDGKIYAVGVRPLLPDEQR